jgi:hypothetical protein
VLVPASFATTAFFLFFQQGTKAVLADNDTTKRKIDAVHSDMNAQFARLRADVGKLLRRDGDSDEAFDNRVPVPVQEPMVFDAPSWDLKKCVLRSSRAVLWALLLPCCGVALLRWAAAA